jgi:pyocin large subunit-like protein
MESERFCTKEQYLQINSKIGGNIEGFTSKDGWVFRYNKLTNEFATAKPDGIIETLFKPKNGYEYWLEQIKLYGGN